MKKISRELVLQYLHPQPNTEYKYLNFQLMPIFLIWGTSYLNIDTRHDHFFQRLLGSKEMKPLAPFIYRFRKGLDPKKLFPTMTLLKFLDGPVGLSHGVELVKRELENYLNSEVKKIKLWSLKKWSKYNQLSFSRLLLCLCIGAAGFAHSKGEQAEEYAAKLYRESNKNPVNFKQVFHFLANGINYDNWWNQASEYEIRIVTSLNESYLNLVARETFMQPEQIASMLVGGIRTHKSPAEREEEIDKKKNTTERRTDWIYPFLNYG